MYSLFIGLLLSLVCGLAGAQGTATWIWSPGDFEIWLSNRMQAQRVERDVAWPPFWRLYNHQPQVNFIRQVDLAAPKPSTASPSRTTAATSSRPRRAPCAT